MTEMAGRLSRVQATLKGVFCVFFVDAVILFHVGPSCAYTRVLKSSYVIVFVCLFLVGQFGVWVTALTAQYYAVWLYGYYCGPRTIQSLVGTIWASTFCMYSAGYD